MSGLAPKRALLWTTLLKSEMTILSDSGLVEKFITSFPSLSIEVTPTYLVNMGDGHKVQAKVWKSSFKV